MGKYTYRNEELYTGSIFTLLFGWLFLSTNGWLWLIPLTFLGLMPIGRGLSRLARSYKIRQKRRKEFPRPRQKANEDEQAILKTASNNNGIVTPAQVVLSSTSLSMEQAEKKLQEMVKKGYASMEVNEKGTIEYHFTEFMGQERKNYE